jgi:ankyrin repeat protein
LACSRGFKEIVVELLKRGIPINAQDKVLLYPLQVSLLFMLCYSKDGSTALFYTCARGDVELSKILLENGATADFRNHVMTSDTFEKR